ncbi:DUF2974 domain-containing protein [bacterium]|nr:DUF2974 domain-containing protein [bacterium]
MGMRIDNPAVSGLNQVQRQEGSTKKADNRAVENQTDVVSKGGNDAVRSMGMALLTRSSKVSDEDQAYVDTLRDKYLGAKPHPKVQAVFDSLFTGPAQEVSERISTFRSVEQRDSSITPMDFASAQKDLKNLKERGLDELTGSDDVEKLTKLSQARHLLGGKYPVDFATEMVDLDATFEEYQTDLGLKEGIEGGSPSTSISSSSKAAEFGIKDDAKVRDFAFLAAQAYANADDLNPEKLKGYSVIGSAASEKNGFASTAFKDSDGNIVIAYRGSDDVSDIKSDLEMINKTQLPEQFYDAQQFYEDIKAKNPGAKIVLTGHSLGGALSQLVAAHNEDSYSVAFNAPGTKDIITRESGLSDTGNIYNVIVDGDKISNTLAQPGQTQIIDAGKDRYGNKLHPHAIANCM